ncbi:uncharacterized protein VTP21DRAFT_462 [Calcarisporiella thermophila]|uniref:uncharacterized protein n=1 Tax=Calcarisporiella thermophila TaxID=911321 RepID=UPI00374308C1
MGGSQDDDAFTILVATDNHVGYLEKDPIRGQDSFTSFEEILQIGKEREVDLILLGGDLFHDNRPTRRTLYQTMKLLRQYCFGNKPVEFEILSDQSVNFPDSFSRVNYEDPNINVSMPVFSIHGNHDDPTGDGSYSALDLLAVSGLVNYFGKSTDLEKVVVSPVLLQKNNTKLAIYGLGNIRDERLHRMYLKKQVKMLRPSERTDDWFNIMVLHQNRAKHGPTNFIPEEFLSDFLHLVIWGHEHECLIDPQFNARMEFHVTQPGSSVATSLAEGEAKEKHVAILKIQGKNYELEKIRLKTVRPFVMEEVVLSEVEGLEPNDDQSVEEYLVNKVRLLIRRAISEWKEMQGDSFDTQELEPPKPLIRLKVEYTGGFNTFNPHRFGQRFVEEVANPKDLILFYRRRVTKETAKKKVVIDPINLDDVEPEEMDKFKVSDLVSEFLNAQSLEVLPENELGDALRLFVLKDDSDAIKGFVNKSLERIRERVKANTKDDNENIIKEQAARQKQAMVDAYAKINPGPGIPSNPSHEADLSEHESEENRLLRSPMPPDQSSSNPATPRYSTLQTARRGNHRGGRNKRAIAQTHADLPPRPRRKRKVDPESEEEEKESNVLDEVEEVDGDTFNHEVERSKTPTSVGRKRKLPSSLTQNPSKRSATNSRKSRSLVGN